MRLTTVICTWNRAELLKLTLEAMTGLEIPEDVEWDLLIVDNNCTDATPDIIAAYADRLPLRSVREPRPGKSHALNRAVAEAECDYLLYTDDDVLVDSGWLRAYRDAIREFPDGVVFGGPIRPWFEGDPPRWLVEVFPRVEFAYAALDLGPEPMEITGRQSPFGANLVIRAEEQKSIRYDPNLGPRPGSGLRGEEVVLVQNLYARGCRGYWVPEATVRHYIPESRQSLAYLEDWYSGFGEYLVRRRPGPEARSFLQRPLWLWRELVESQVRYRLKKIFGRPGMWIEELKKLAMARGRFVGYGRPPADPTDAEAP
ncbi:MAG: glycosyltransferase [Anaerolineales bacterium]|nr:glycosyltransferase [Anaerolineales bacterium]